LAGFLKNSIITLNFFSMLASNNIAKPISRLQNIARFALGILLMIAGTIHLTTGRSEFQAQVPDWVPLSKDLTVVLSGIVEIALGVAIAFWLKRRVLWGWVAAVFFTLIFPGNISQFANHRSAFGLNTDMARGVRLLFQPVLIAWALWSTGAWAARALTCDRRNADDRS
jgi:uncharacterized membrane protein